MSVAKNFLYNSAITISTYIVGFLVFPHVSRVLGVSNVGVIGYVDNIINYFILFSTLGLQSVGIREIAATANNPEKSNVVFNQLLSLLIVLLVIASSVFITCVYCVPRLFEYRPYLLVGLGKLIFTPLLIEWLFIGNQDFRYISIRTIVIKFLYLISVFVFVKDKNDTVTYFLLTSISVLLNFVVNSISARRYVKFQPFKYGFGAILRPVIKLGIFTLITSLYSTFNYIYLRNVSTVIQVGLYYTAIKLYDVIMQLFRAYTSVVLPKMSEMIANRKNDECRNQIKRSYDLLFSIGIPVVFVTMLLSPQIIRIIAGEGYEDAIIPMRIIMPIMLIAGLNQINGIQILLPLHKDNVLLITGSLAAIVGVFSNVILDIRYGAMGAAITILLSEIVGCLGGLLYLINKKIVAFPWRNILRYFISSMGYVIISMILGLFRLNYLISFTIGSTLMFIYFFAQQKYICKNDLVTNLAERVIKRIWRQNKE